MHKLIQPTAITFVLLLLIFSSSCQWEHSEISSVSIRSDGHVITPISESDLSFDGLKLGDSYETFQKKLNEEHLEKTVVNEPDFDYEEITYQFNKMEVVFVNDSCYSILISRNDFETPRGLRVGDSMNKLIELYGQPHRKVEQWWIYTYDGGNDYEVFNVAIVNGKVASIKISLTM